MYKDILFSKYFNLFYEFLFQIYFRLHDKNELQKWQILQICKKLA